MTEFQTPCTPDLEACVRDLSRHAEPFAVVYFVRHHNGHCAMTQIPGLLKARVEAEGRQVAIGNLHATTLAGLDDGFGSPTLHLARTQLRAAGRFGAACEALLLATDVAGIANQHAASGACFTCPRFPSSWASQQAGTAAADVG